MGVSPPHPFFFLERGLFFAVRNPRFYKFTTSFGAIDATGPNGGIGDQDRFSGAIGRAIVQWKAGHGHDSRY